jgi:preprotein translocase subunit SecG
MQLVFLVIQVILAVAIIGTVLLQKTGGDGLGSLGGGGGISGNSIISGRASASFLTKATTVLMMAFMVNSLILGNLSVREHSVKSVIEKTHKEKVQIKETTPQVPVSE